MTYTDQTSLLTAHTLEPWTWNHQAIVQDAAGNIIADCEILPECVTDTLPPELEVANARRIVAAVNACQGIPTKALEQGIVAEMLNVLEHFYNWLTPDWQQSSLGDKARAAIARAKGAVA